MVSWYHHALFRINDKDPRMNDMFRSELPFEDYDDIKGTLPVFIERAFSNPVWPHFSWSQFVRRWLDRPGVYSVRYEDMHHDPITTLQNLVAAVAGRRLSQTEASEIVDLYLFKRPSGREAGKEDKGNLLRKGIVGDWRNHFSKEARQVFDRSAGSELVALGYETDRNWVNDNSQYID